MHFCVLSKDIDPEGQDGDPNSLSESQLKCYCYSPCVVLYAFKYIFPSVFYLHVCYISLITSVLIFTQLEHTKSCLRDSF